MRNILLILLTALVGLFASCDKMPSDSDLNGRWQLTAINATAPATPTYWSFQLDLLSITTSETLHNGQTGETVGRFIVTPERLQITALYVHFRDRDELITPASDTPSETGNASPSADLSSVGIIGHTADFAIETLSSSHLTLVDKNHPVWRLSFKKIN